MPEQTPGCFEAMLGLVHAVERMRAQYPSFFEVSPDSGADEALRCLVAEAPKAILCLAAMAAERDAIILELREDLATLRRLLTPRPV